MSQYVDFHAIPDDVLYRVFKQFLSTRELVLSCTTVSKRWRALTFPSIFSTLWLTVKTEGDPKLEINRYIDDLVHDPFFPSIQYIVSSLRLTWGRSPIGLDFVEFIPYFPSLRNLTFSGTVCMRLPAHYTHAQGTIDLDTLFIEGICGTTEEGDRVYHDASALCNLLSVFGTIGTLKLRNFSSRNLAFDKRLPFDWHHWTSPRPQSLVLENHQEESGFFEAAPFMRYVQDLDIVAIETDHNWLLPGIAAACGQLHKLSIALHHPRRDDPVYNLASFPSLRILVLCVTARRAPYRSMNSNEYMPYGDITAAAATIRTLAAGSASLDYIHIRFRCAPAGPCDAKSRLATRHKTLANFPGVFRHRKGVVHFRDLEDALLELIDAGRVGHVRVSLYALDYWDFIADIALAVLPASDCAQIVFPRLFERKVLYFKDI
ncbi:hypothetical protein PsYK624_107070 [Phanerochaete sordida]|uniref:F-box domain-containing protein n=1 Tax=Phanerochaete sordida TaxID=48140 RepID=A0A9P3GF40_9APHY|nr:hypothetical protein PsYK624_107070 [Phanerochaete sordida]